jgi:signal transduction histidine kinase
MKPGSWLLPATVALAGLCSTAIVAAASGLAATDTVTLIAYAAGGAALAGILASSLLGLLRRSSVVALAAVAGLASVVAAGIGVAGAASAMFISRHDLHVLWVVLVAAGTVGLVMAVVLGRRVAQAGRSLEEMARRLADEGAGLPSARARVGPRAASPAELASLGAELELTSARLAEAREQAAALERSRRELVAWVSHDLRTPLAGIRAMVEALEDGVVDDPETVDRYHRTMRQEADRLAGLVDDLFELSRIHAGALSLDLERVALDELVSEALASASIAAIAKGIDLRGTVGEPSPVVELSTREMARVVRNLLDNAIRHTDTGRTVSIHAGIDDTGSAAEVSVRDSCGGIPEADIAHVFDLAYRGDTARTPGEGAGLGLAVARGLVEAHHGHISVRNEGDGCRFTVRLPLAAPAPRPVG